HTDLQPGNENRFDNGFARFAARTTVTWIAFLRRRKSTRLPIQLWFLAPVVVLFVPISAHTGSAFAQAHRFEAAVVPGGLVIFTGTFQTQRVGTWLRPEVEQMYLLIYNLRAVQIHYVAELHAVQGNLVLAEVIGLGQVQ